MGFTYRPGQHDKAPELKILNNNNQEKIAFHFSPDQNPTTPSTVNCPYRQDGTREWKNQDSEKQQFFIAIVELCRKTVTDHKAHVWKWHEQNTEPNTFFPHSKPNAQTAVIASTTHIPECFHQP